MSTVRFVLLRHARDNVLDPASQQEHEWDEFCEWIVEEGHEIRGIAGEPSLYETEFKDGSRGATKPAGMILADPRWGEPALEDDVDIDFVERKGTDVLRRAKRNFESACAAVAMDLDDLSPEEYQALHERLKAYDAVEYSTYSHGKNPSKVKLRLIVRLDREQEAGEVSRIRRGSGVLLGVQVDTQTIDVSRIFYRPAAHPDRASQAFIHVHHGKALSADACLAEAPITEKDILAGMELVWDGVTPASQQDRDRAEAELDAWIARCGYMNGDDSKRGWLLQKTMRFGSYIVSGCLPGAETRRRMHERVRELMTWAWSADDHTLAYRLAQIDKGLADGQAKGGLIPSDPAEMRKRKVIEQAHELSIPGALAERLAEVSGGASRDLMNNAPDVLVTLDEARKSSFEFGMRIRPKELLVDSSSAGTGKSYNMAKIASAKARLGLTVVIQTRENTVAAQTREQIDPDISSIQLYSPLSPPEQAPPEHRCLRAQELDYLKGSGTPIRAVCTRCPQNKACPALDAHRERLEALPDAQVVFVSQAGVGQASELLESGALLMTDEQPDVGDWDALSDETLQKFANGVRIPWIPQTGANEVFKKIASALLEKEPMPEFDPEVTWEVPAQAYREASQEDRELVQISKKLWGVYLKERQWSRTARGTRIWKLERAYLTLSTYGGLLCDATPLRPALPKDMPMTELRQHVQDAAPVKRVFVSCPNRTGSGGLFPNGVVDKPRVEEMLQRLNHYVDRDGAKSVLLVTFKAIEEWINENRSSLTLPPGLELAHFGAVRGKNQWKNFDLIYVFGTPRFNREPLLQHLLKDSGRVREEWERCAAAELEQAIARLRPVSRTTPCTMVCESEVVPWSWYATMGNFEIVLLPEDQVNEAALRTLLNWVATGVKQKDIAEALKVDKSQFGRWREAGRVPKNKVYVILSHAFSERFDPEPPEEEPDIPVDAATSDDVDSPEPPEEAQ